MGRHHPHHLKLPEHLYLSPPPTPPPYSDNAVTSSLLSVKPPVFPDPYGARAVSNKIPGFRTSAAFLTTLRANLTIELDSPTPSLCNTPDSLRPVHISATTGSIVPPLPSPLAHAYDLRGLATNRPVYSPSSQLPSLTTAAALTEDDKVEVLHLIADSVAQQRHHASSAILSHPVTIAVELLVIVVVFKSLYRGLRSDWALIGTTLTVLLITALILIRLLTQGYIYEAESVGTWTWLDKGRHQSANIVGSSDECILSRHGDRAMGALVMRGVREPSSSASTPTTTSSGQRKRRQNSRDKNAPVTGMIRGWTVKNSRRRQGIGTELLEEAVRLCQRQGWQGPEFDSQHANSKHLVPFIFTSALEKREFQARTLLERVKTEMGVGPTLANSHTGGGRKRR